MVTQSNSRRRYMTEILPIRRKTLYNQSINQSKEVVNSGDWVEYTKFKDVIAGLILISTKCNACRHTYNCQKNLNEWF